MNSFLLLAGMLLGIAVMEGSGAGTHEYDCRWTNGNGNGNKVYVGGQTGRGGDCTRACIRRKEAFDYAINGVTIYSNLDKGGCWCLRETETWNWSRDTEYKTCKLVIKKKPFVAPQVVAKPDATPYTCTFINGDGVGGSEINIGTHLKGQACASECIKRRNNGNSRINGVSVYADSNRGGCWCEYSMTRVAKSSKYKTCLLVDPYDLINFQQFSCKFVSGDGTGSSEVKIGNHQGQECVDACIARKRAGDRRINGATTYADVRKYGCWCEQWMTRVEAYKTAYKTCQFTSPVDNSEYDCRFKSGYGDGVSTIYLGSRTGQGGECTRACLKRKKDGDSAINGITITLQGGCWCVRGQNGRRPNNKYKYCDLVKKSRR